MSKAIIQIDANNFYASCEQMIDPSIKGKGLVILSNNDGCIIARNSEARKMGIPMGKPYFKLKNKLNQLNINVRSSNYELYGDISNRLMQLLRKNCEELEIYSIDEAFATIKRPSNKYLYQWGSELRGLIYQNIGIPISIGIGDTKVQSKIANHIAKKIKKNSGLFDISIIENKDYFLSQIRIDEVWGVGKRMSEWLRIRGIHNAKDLRNMSSMKLREKYGIVGIRIQRELNGEKCIPLQVKQPDRKEICISRSFGYPIDSLAELKKAIAKFVISGSQKLRKYNQSTSMITIFTNTSHYSEGFFKSEAKAKLEIPSDDTITILKPCLELTNKIFKPYKKLIKAGIIMSNLQSKKYQQNILFNIQDVKQEIKRNKLNKIIDSINTKNGRETLNWSSSVLDKEWSPRRNKISTFKTTKIESIPIIFAN